MIDSQFAFVKRVIQRLQSTQRQGLYYAKLDLNSMRVVVLSNVALVSDLGLGNQLDYVLSVTNKKQNESVIHYGSSRCHRIAYSFMAAQVHEMIHAGDVGMILQNALFELLYRSSEMEAFVYSKTVLSTVTNHSRTAEKRLQTDILASKKSCKKGELKGMGWTQGKQAPVDGLTKEVL